jgi:hypothetical protein
MSKLLKTTWLFLLVMITLTGTTNIAIAQNITVNTATLEGLDITPDNMWGFQIVSVAPRDVQCGIEGNLVFRNTSHSIKYKFVYTVKPGLNVIDPHTINPGLTFSSQALRELFMDYKVLPQGTYQYCVVLTPNITNTEFVTEKVDDCIYKQSKDLFSINLLEPENGAKIYEYNPMLSWIATYPFPNQLTYKIRIAEIKEGQNTANAIVRNNAIYSENNLMTNSIVYPVYGKPLQVWQPYAWTVDAYYKGIFLGGAQPWKFTIVEDSILKTLPKQSSYIDINIDKGDNRYYAVGNAKIKYSENDFLQNELKIKLVKKGIEIKSSETVWRVERGVSFYTYDLTDFGLNHNQEFEIIIEFKNAKNTQNKQELKFRYVNPDFVK